MWLGEPLPLWKQWKFCLKWRLWSLKLKVFAVLESRLRLVAGWITLGVLLLGICSVGTGWQKIVPSLFKKRPTFNNKNTFIISCYFPQPPYSKFCFRLNFLSSALFVFLLFAPGQMLVEAWEIQKLPERPILVGWCFSGDLPDSQDNMFYCHWNTVPWTSCW